MNLNMNRNLMPTPTVVDAISATRRITPYASVRMNALNVGSYKGFNGIEGSPKESYRDGLGFVQRTQGNCNWVDDFGDCLSPSPNDVIVLASGERITVGNPVGTLGNNASAFSMQGVKDFFSQYGTLILLGGVIGVVLSKR